MARSHKHGMHALQQLTGVYLYAGLFVLTIASALFPWVNSEILILSASALAKTTTALVLAVVVGSAGQVVGNVTLYWIGRGTLHVQSRKVARTVERWRDRLDKYRYGPFTLILLASTFGIPPLYVTTVASGALKVPLLPFFLLCSAGRLVRFSVLVFAPRLVIQLFR